MAGGEEDENMGNADRTRDESSDDDIEIVPKSVDNYWLEHGDESPVSFATLPYFKTGEEAMPDKVVYLRGTQDNGMRLYMRAVAWKLELTKDMKPVFHLKTEKYWIQLLKPRKSYEESIRSIMSVAQFLNYTLVNPNDPERVVWNHVNEVFPSWEVQASRNDLSSHLPVIQHLIASDEHLAGSSALQNLDTGSSKKRPALAMEDGRQSSRKRMYVSDDEDNGDIEPEPYQEKKRGKLEVEGLDSGEEMDGFGEETESDVGDLSETVCCICDDGGAVLCCDGPCMRSFHLNKGADGADDSNCATLGFSKAEVERMDKFFCPNCKFKEHQCYACGELGCSDETAGAAQEVFVCDAAMCGHFYHPACVAELILREKDNSEQAALADSIKEGKGFVCPMHKCWRCGKGEVKEDEDLQFGICRRCPRVWHRKCFPSFLRFEETDDEPIRAWDDILPNRILVYCKRHAIIKKLGTPARTHVKFPEGSLPSARKALGKSKAEQEAKKTKLSKSDSLKKKNEAGLKSPKLPDLDAARKKKPVSSIGQIKSDAWGPTKSKLVSQGSTAKENEWLPAAILIKGRIDSGASTKQGLFAPIKDEQTSSKPNHQSKGRSDLDGLAKQERMNARAVKPPTPKESALQQLQQRSKPPSGKAGIIDSEGRSMVDGIIEKTKASVTVESVLRKLDIPLCYKRSSKNLEKKYSLVKIESIIRGMRKAVETLENGGSIEDAKAKCSPDFIRHLELCRTDLRVYLSPFLYGSRYTSFGRHFTKTEKLEQIVDRLHWYVEKGDMVVDFCCGANEFSLLMKKKLEETGKKCDYKNFDIIQTKNDFNFVKRDWFQVKQDELVDGNRLIMGLNPPFGVKGQLANSFIDCALKFRPKLIVLIVPKETEKLDRKHDKYDLIWEDSDLLEGQSFYLPGSVDVNENPLNDWNAVAPPLYIWSRPDWTLKHRQVALEKGHISPNLSSRYVGSPWKPPPRPPSPVLMLDTGVDKNRNYAVPMEPRIVEEISGLEKNRNHTALVEPRIVEENAGLQQTCPNADTSNSAKLKNKNRTNGALVEPKVGDVIASMPDSHTKENMPHSSKLKVTNKAACKDENPEVRRAELLTKTVKEERVVSQANQLIKNNRKEELPKEKSPEGKGPLHTRKIENARHNSQESPEKARRSSEIRHDVSRQGRKSNDRYERDSGSKVDLSLYDGQQRNKTSEKHRLSMEADLGGRKSPNRYDRYEPGRRKSPDNYDRHGISRHEEQRKSSPERSRHSSVPTEYRNASPERSRHSSVVDLEMHGFSTSRDTNNDDLRGYDGLMRRTTTEKGYQDSTSHTQVNPLNRDYFDGEALGVGRRDAYSVHGINGQRRVYDDASVRGANGTESTYPIGDYTSESRTQAYKGHDVQMAGHFDEAAFARQGRPTDFYHTEPPRGMFGLQERKYGGDTRINPIIDQYRYGLPELRTDNSFGQQTPQFSGRDWPGTVMPTIPAPPYPPIYGSLQPHQQAALGLSDPSLLSSHGLFDNRLARVQTNLPQYPPIQGRFPGQANSGGWIED